METTFIFIWYQINRRDSASGCPGGIGAILARKGIGAYLDIGAHFCSCPNHPLGLERNPGILLYSIVDPKIRAELEALCQDLNVPNLSILDPLVDLFTTVLGYKQNSRPGGQHKLDRAYFERMAR